MAASRFLLLRADIERELASRLRPYLGFRHVFRNIYGSQLRRPVLRDLADPLDGVREALRAEPTGFQRHLAELARGCRED